MKPVPKDRPDWDYWTTRPGKRYRFSEEAHQLLVQDLQVYYQARFKKGTRFRLTKNYAGIPKGTICAVVHTWPHTRVLFEKWGKGSFIIDQDGCSVPFELDMLLEYV